MKAEKLFIPISIISAYSAAALKYEPPLVPEKNNPTSPAICHWENNKLTLAEVCPINKEPGLTWYNEEPEPATNNPLWENNELTTFPEKPTIIQIVNPQIIEKERQNEHLRQQDEAYDRSGLGYIDPPSPHEPLPQNFSEFSRQTYLFTDQYIAEFSPYVKDHLYKNNPDTIKIACVAGSGDWLINQIMEAGESGREISIDAVDTSPVALIYNELKLAGLSSLTYDEFLKFFDPKSQKFLSHNQYINLKPYLTNRAQYFLNQVILPEGNLIAENMFIHYENIDIKKINPYLESEENYEKARSAYKKAKEKSNPVTFHLQDLETFLANKENEYNLILASNIHTLPPYVNELRTQIHFSETTRLITHANNALKPESHILFYTAASGSVDYAQRLNQEIAYNYNKKMIEMNSNKYNPQEMIMTAGFISGKSIHDSPNTPKAYSLLILEKPADS